MSKWLTNNDYALFLVIVGLLGAYFNQELGKMIVAAGLTLFVQGRYVRNGDKHNGIVHK